jgi:galactokinase
MTPEASTMKARVNTVATHHREKTGTEPKGIFQAPGRVNLLGEHTDYSGGFCMPAALSFNTIVAASPRTDNLLRLHSLDFHETAEMDLAALRPGEKGHWSAYGFGVAWSLQQSGVVIHGADLTLSGNVPLGSGLSSSASVEVAVATTLLALAKFEMPKPKVALACQKAENDFVGAPCGIMDQFISACGVRGNALAIDTRSLTAELAPIPDDLRLVVCNSMVRHSVGGGEYGERRREVEEAAHAISLTKPQVHQLRDASLADLEAARSQMSHEAFLRGRHVITDSQRVLDGLACLRAGDSEGFGALMTAAHASFRDDFGASCSECDLLVELALKLQGCLGSRLTGGGFGGCTVSLVNATSAEVFAAALQEGYRQATGVQPQTFICEIADGAGPVKSY